MTDRIRKLTNGSHMKTAQDRKGLVLSGGGARAAYQVGALRAIAQLLPEDAANPFHIIAGTPAGALNAASIASHAANLRSAVRTLEQVWSNLDSSQVYRQDSRLITSASQWVFSFLANRGKETQTSLLDNSPLEN